MLRFVILHHNHPLPHWDLLLARPTPEPDTLRSWRLDLLPLEAGVRGDAESIPDHRPLYLDFQGEVSGGRGTVEQFDAGPYTALEWSDNRVTVLLQGNRLSKMILRLIRHEDVSPTPTEVSPRWSFQLESASTESTLPPRSVPVNGKR